MKKISILLLVLFLCMSVIGLFSITGCKIEQVAEKPAEESTEQVVEELVEESKEVLSVIMWVSSDPAMAKVNQMFVEEFNEQNPGIRIVIEDLGKDADLADKLNLVYTQGSYIPDIIEYHPAFNRNIIEAGYLSPVPDSVLTVQEMEEQIYADLLKSIEMDGKYYQVPIEHNFDCGILLANMSLLEDAGIELPEGWPATWDDVIDVAKRATIFDNSGKMIQSGLALGERDGRIFLAGILQQGASFIDEDKLLFDLQTEEAKKSLEFYTNIALQDKVWQAGFPGRLAAMEQGVAAMMFSGIWEIGILNESYPDIAENIKTFDAPPFFGDPPRITLTYGGWGYGVSAESPHQEAAWEYIKFATSKENRERRLEFNPILPAFKEDANFEFYQDPLYKPAIEILPYTQSIWPAKSSVNIWRATDPYVNMVMSGEMTIDDALTTMEDECNKAMDEWWRK